MHLATAWGGPPPCTRATGRSSKVQAGPCGGLLRPAARRHASGAGHRAAPIRPSPMRRRLQPARSFEGDAVKALKEAAMMDEVVDSLLGARSQQELAQLVAENIFNIDDIKFWMRVATRSDSAASQADKDKLASMAETVMGLVLALKQQTESKLSDSAQTLQAILRAAADENGEWFVPLRAEEVQRMRDALDAAGDAGLDEALLSNAFAYIKKASDDGFDTMAALIQKALQLYAARALAGPEKEGVDGAVNRVVWAEEQQWATIIRDAVQQGSISEAAFMEALQRKMENTVLGQASGSYAQRVQAEYLKEVEARAKQVFRDLAAAGGGGGGAASSGGASA